MAKADSSLIFRYGTLDGTKIDRSARTIPISFSSETAAPQRENGQFAHITGLSKGDVYYEILDHSPENADFSQLNNRGAFLDEHDDKDQIGVVEKAELDATTKRGMAVVKLSAHDKGMRRFSEMEANERPHISAGYKYTRKIGEERLPNGKLALRFAWKAFEISSVATPNDPTVGVGRSLTDVSEVDSSEKLSAEEIHKNLTPEQKTRMKILLDAKANEGGGTVTIDENKIRADEAAKARTAAAGEFKTRSKEIVTIADTLIAENGKRDGGKMAEKIRSMANTALQSDESIPDFKVRCMEEVLKAKPVEPVYVEDCTDENGMRRYSLQRGIQDCITGKKRTPGGLEGEVHQEYVNQCKQRSEGLGFNPEGEFLVPSHSRKSLIPTSSLSRGERSRMTRDQQATVFAAGGATVATILMTPIIELLRNRMCLSNAGVTMLGGLTGNVVIPRQEAPTTAYSVSEIQQITQSILLLGQIALTPKRVGSSITYSKQWLMQSTPDAESLVRDDAFKVIALKWDVLGLNGQGAASEPLGVFNTPGIGAVTFGATPTYIKMIAFETAIRTQNVTDPLTYMTTSTVKGSLKGVAEALTGATTIGGSQNAIWKPGDTINGYPAIDSQQIPNNLVLCGAFSQLIHALWGGLDVVVDYWTLADKAEVKLSINTWGDYAVRHPQAFCASTDAGNQ